MKLVEALETVLDLAEQNRLDINDRDVANEMLSEEADKQRKACRMIENLIAAKKRFSKHIQITTEEY